MLTGGKKEVVRKVLGTNETSIQGLDTLGFDTFLTTAAQRLDAATHPVDGLDPKLSLGFGIRQ